MKIIDEHVHIGQLGPFDMRPSYVIESMERYGISYSLVSSGLGVEFDQEHRPLPDDWAYTQYSGNRETVAFARQYDGRIGVLPWCKPHTEGFNDEFEKLLREGGSYIKGLKFHPFYSMLPMTAPEVEPYLSYAAQKELPVLIHTASDEFSGVGFVYEAAKAHPRVNFIMAHVGLGTDHNEAIELIGSLPNLYGDTAWVEPEAGLKLMKKYGAHKLLFGTDNPIDGVDSYAHPFYRTYFGEFRQWVSPDDYELLMHGNAERLYHL